MAFAVSDGQVVSIHRPSYTAPTALAISDDYTQDYAAIYRSQAYVRIAVDFLARNVAQLSLHPYRKVSQTDRVRLAETDPFAALLSFPNSFTTTYRLVRDNVADRGIFDRALWLKTFEGTGSDKRQALVRVPPQMWTIDPNDSNWLRPSAFIVRGSMGEARVPADQCVYFRGYNPEDGRNGLSPIESLRRMLSEEYAGGQMREQIMRNGARVSGYLKRPATAPEWSANARATFKAGWRAQYSGASATAAGGTPILEDGMEFVPASQTAQELQYVESRKLSREEVAAAYFIPPPMIGILDNATFGNITEQHKMLYQDTLGPVLQEFQQEIALQLLPDFFAPGAGVYVEFNMMEKLRGSFEEQAAQLQSSVGAPFLTRNEARARANLPAIDGADELVVPLNVLVGGLASPNDTAPEVGALSGDAETVQAVEAAIKRVGLKTRPADSYQAKVEEVLGRFFARQERAVRSALGGKAPWWDGKRWDRELSADLLAVSMLVSTETARSTLGKLGLGADGYNPDQTRAYLEAVAKADAASINAATESQIADALADDEGSVDHVFEVAKGSRSHQAALTIVTALAGFATVEAVKQVPGPGKAIKRWVVTSGNPRPSHAGMDGETVALDDVFSNGAKWPGDGSALDVDERAGCSCDLVIEFE